MDVSGGLIIYTAGLMQYFDGMYGDEVNEQLADIEGKYRYN